jgi:hypothetical protein
MSMTPEWLWKLDRVSGVSRHKYNQSQAVKTIEFQSKACQDSKATQLRGIKSKLLYFPDKNHWVFKQEKTLVWQRELYKWLKKLCCYLLIQQGRPILLGQKEIKT